MYIDLQNQLKNLSDDKLNRTIATILGWSGFDVYEDNQGPDIEIAIPPKNWPRKNWELNSKTIKLPWFLTHDEMSKLILTLDDDQKYVFGWSIMGLTDSSPDDTNDFKSEGINAYKILMTTPIQKAISFIISKS